MKPKSTFLMLVFGLVVALFACENQGVVEPEDVISPDGLMVSSTPCWKDPTQDKCQEPPVDPPSTGEPTLDLKGVLEGYAGTDVTWEYKKGLFKARVMERGSISVVTQIVVPDGNQDAFKLSCKGLPEGQAADDLRDALFDGQLTGILANLFVDEAAAASGTASPDNRILSLVEGPLVRYYWIGPRYAFGDEFPDDFDKDATVTDFIDDLNGTITYTLTGGVIGVRDVEGPKTHTQIACPNLGSVYVKISPEEADPGT